MARQLKVFAVSLLLACLFSFSAFAEWSISDSSNLSSIKTYTSNIQSYVSTISSNLSSIRTDISSIKSYTSNLSSILTDTGEISAYSQTISNLLTNNVSGWYQFFVKLTSIDNKLSTVNNNLDSLEGKQDTTNNNLVDINDTATVNGETLTDIYNLLDDRLESGVKPDYSQMYLAFDSTYITSPKEPLNYMVSSSGSYVFLFNGDRPLLYTFTPGRYAFLINTSVAADSDSIFYFDSVGTANISSYFSDADGYINRFNINRYLFYIDVTDNLALYGLNLKIPSSSDWYGSCYIYKLDDGEEGLVDSLEPSFSDKQTDLDDGIDQLEGQEDSVFTSLDTSIGSLDFSGSALGQVVTGFTFIRAVFSAIYSSSPYISVLINLSCMLGVLALFLRVQPRFSRWEREHRDRDS